MDELVRNLDQDRIKVYRGQILVHTSDNEEHLNMLADLFQELHRFDLKVDVNESQFFQSQLIYLGKDFVLITKQCLRFKLNETINTRFYPVS